MYFPSKKDVWFGLIIWGFVVFLIAAYVFGGEPIGMQFITYNSIAGYILSALIIGLLLWFWFGTGYKIEGSFIKIKFEPLTSKVKIADITKLRETKNPMSAPALSIDRIEILYGKYGMAHLFLQKIECSSSRRCWVKARGLKSMGRCIREEGGRWE